MSRQSSIGLDVRTETDGAELRGGVNDERLLKWLGSDITITGTGSEIYTFPLATDTLVGRISTDTLQNKTIISAILNTQVTGDAVLDEDDMASDSDTKVATQQAIKAYFDNKLGSFTHEELADMPSADVADHDGRYFTEVELSGSGGAGLIGMLIYGTPTYDNVQDWNSIMQSAGVIDGNGGITDAGSGNINVAAGKGIGKTANTEISPNVFLDWDARNGIAITPNVKTTVYIDYNATPQVQITTNPSADIDHTTKFSIASVFYDGTDMHILNEAGTRIYNLARRTHHRAIQLRGFERAKGLVTSDKGTLHIEISAGIMYAGLNEISLSGFNSITTQCITWYYDGDLGTPDWVRGTSNTLDAVQYNNVATGLANLTSKRYGVHWIFMDVDSHCNIVYGQGNYTLSQAQNALLPSSLPTIINDFSILVARVIVQEGETEITEIATAFETLFPTATATNHNELSSLQGGQADEYYHLTAQQNTDVPLNTTHRGLTNNPHSVTADQLGLGTAAVEDVGTGSGNIPQLNASGKLVDSVIPALSISEYLGNFADTATALADAGVQASQRGDWFTVNTSGGLTYIVTTDSPTTTGDITLMSTPTDSVSSVNGHTGIVVLDPDDLDDTATTNKFTTAVEISKLAGIESGATADQTGAEIKTAYEAEADTNAFTDAEKTKLSGIETLADVTDTTNVTAAGALMDSEVDADIKTLVLPANTTISTFGASLVDDSNAETARITLGLNIKTVTKTSNYTATTSDDVILCDASGGSFTITLYASTGNNGKKLIIKKIDSSANTVTIDGNASETIDGEDTQIIELQYTALKIVTDASNWHII